MFMRDFQAEFVDPDERCPNCRWTGKRSELVSGNSEEIYHPKNKDGIVHGTNYERCPRCGRWIYADGLLA